MLRPSLVLLGVVFGVVPALAQVPDHLKCYKVKDSLAKAEYTADLGGRRSVTGEADETIFVVCPSRSRVPMASSGGRPADRR